MSDIFTDTEIENSSESYDDYFIESYNDNCPPGHYISIQVGGRGHGYGDSCGCDGINPETNIDFIAPLLMLSAFTLCIIVKLKINKN